MDEQRVETLVIGGGQAGLAVGYHLARRGLPFLIVDAHDRIGDAWRTRWDSLRLFTPNRFNNLPGMRFPGPRWGFPTKDEFAYKYSGGMATYPQQHAPIAVYSREADKTFFVFGGVAEMEDEPPSPKAEFCVAIAGPIASIVLAVLFLATADWGGAIGIPESLLIVARYLGFMNAILAGFNIVPAFPLDGGRVDELVLADLSLDEQAALEIGTRLALCRLEREQHATSHLEGIVERLQTGRSRGPFGVPEVRVGGTCGHDQVVEREASGVEDDLSGRGVYRARFGGGTKLTIEADAEKLRSIVDNLIGNAIDHMGLRRDARIEVTIEEDERQHEIVVSDNGRGVDPAHRDRIFEVFQSIGTRSDGRRGTGMGLAIVKKIVEKRGGRVWLESEPGCGARFHVTLPRR